MTDNATSLLPPSARDFHVYEHVAVEGNSTRQAAQKFKISQTRVCQVIRQVAAFTASVLPGILESEVPEAQRLVMSRNVAGLRLAHLYEEAMTAWRNSRGEAWRIRDVHKAGYHDSLRTTWKQQGQLCYLMQAVKISRVAMELAIPLPLGMLARIEQEEEEHDREVARGEDRDEEQAAAVSGEPAGGEAFGDAANGRQPNAAELFDLVSQIRQMAQTTRALRDELFQRDERIAAATAAQGDCSPLAEAAASSPATAAPAAAQVQASSADAPAAQAAAVPPPIAAQGLFTRPEALDFPRSPRANGTHLTRQQRRARQRRAEQLLAQRRSPAECA